MAEATKFDLGTADWRVNFDARQQAELELACVYVERFNHGTAGHNRLQLIARLAALLDEIYGEGGLRSTE